MYATLLLIVSTTALVLAVRPAAGDQASSPGGSPAREASLDEVCELLAEADSWRALQWIERGEPLQVVTRYSDLVMDLYWKKKDLDAVLVVGRAGIHYGLSMAQAENARNRAELQDAARTMAYNLGSFTWPGWDEAGIVLHPHHMAAGLDAARLYLRLAGELEKPPVARSRAHWLLGAHRLSAGQYAQAIDHFRQAAAAAGEADSPAEVLLNQGYVAVARRLRHGDGDAGAQAELDRIREALNTLKDGPFFAEQLVTVEAALRKWRDRPSD